jgi:hypothetical protein
VLHIGEVADIVFGVRLTPGPSLVREGSGHIIYWALIIIFHIKLFLLGIYSHPWLGRGWGRVF